MAMSIELLPNEVWLEIFSYIHIGDITCAFLRLNNRLTNLIHSLPTNVHHYEMNESYFYGHLTIRHTHISVRDGRSFSFHYNRKHLVWLCFDRPSQRQLQFLQSTYFPNLKHLHFNGIGTINHDVAQFYYTIFNSNHANDIPSLISCSITRQFDIRRKYVLIHPGEGEMKKIKCWLIPKMFINWKQNFYLVKIYRVIFVC